MHDQDYKFSGEDLAIFRTQSHKVLLLHCVQVIREQGKNLVKLCNMPVCTCVMAIRGIPCTFPY